MGRRARVDEEKQSESALVAADALIPPTPDVPPLTERVVMGPLVKPWGVRGEQTVLLYNPGSDLLERLDAVYIEGAAFPARRVGRQRH